LQSEATAVDVNDFDDVKTKSKESDLGITVSGESGDDFYEFGICGKYIPLQEVTLVEGAEASGKTTLICGIMAHGSVGYSEIVGEHFEPYNSLIITSEQRPGAVKRRVQKLGGDPNRVFVMKSTIALDGDTLKKIEAEIVKRKIKLFVIDPGMDYRPNYVNENSRSAVRNWIGTIQEVAERTNSACIFVNHFAKFVRGKDMTDLGANNGGMKSRARSSLLVFTDPDNISYKAVIHARGNIDHAPERPFAYYWTPEGRIKWVSPGWAETGFIEDKVLKARK